MKKNVVLMMLSLSITATSIAQDQPQASKTEQTFNISAGYFKRDFSFDLGNGNRMQIQLSDIADLDKIINMDSLLHDFFVAIATLEDTLSDELTSKRIDYLADSAGRKKIRVQVYPQKSLSYFLQQGNLAALKLEQDTINIIGLVSYTAKYTLRKAFAATRYYQVSFFINQVSDLKKIPANTLNNKISAIQDKKDGKWTKTKDGRWHINSMGQDIYSKEQGGYIGSRGDYLEMRISVNAQNYKNYFVPSFSLGAAVILSNGFFKRDIGLFWEPHFLFSKNAQGNLQTYRNDFITLTFGQGAIKDNDARKESSFLTDFSLGYLVKRKGEYFEKNTLRFGAGQVSLFGGKTKIQPSIYFTDLFKGVTPGIRWIQHF